MDWIHCNSCFKQPRQSAPGRKFFLTSCGHIYCGACVNAKPLQEKCLVCASTYTIIHLNEEMKPEVQEYFKDVQTSLTKLGEVTVFQNGHRQRLATHSKLVDDKYAAAKEEVKRMYELDKTNQKRIQELENELKFYKRKVNELQAAATRTPGLAPGSSRPLVHKPMPSPILSGSMKMLSQKILQTTQGTQKPREHMFLTPNRLTLHYKGLSATPAARRPSPDSTMTPTQSSRQNFGVNFGAHRSYNPQYSSQSTPGNESPAVPVHSPNTPSSAQGYRLSGGVNTQQRSRYYDSSVPVPGVSPPNVGSLYLNTHRERNDQQNKR